VGDHRPAVHDGQREERACPRPAGRRSRRHRATDLGRAREGQREARSRRGGQAMMTPLRVLLAAVVLAGCASILYDARDPSATIYISVSPGGFGSTPMGRRVEWTWQHRSVDNARFVRDNEICNAASKTNTATMIRGQ